MLYFISFLLGSSLQLAAMGIPIGSSVLQSTVLLSYTHLLTSIWIYRERLPKNILMCECTMLLLLYVAWAYAFAAHPSLSSLVYLIYYIGVVSVFMASCVVIFNSNSQTDAFINGMVLTSIIIAAISICLYASGSNETLQSFRNNTNFSLPLQINRLSGLMPEASSFAHILIVSLVLLIISYGSKYKLIRLPLSKLGHVFSIFIVGTALIMTKSTSLFFILPLLVGYYIYFKYRMKIKHVIAGVAIICLFAGLMFAFYYNYYLTRGHGAMSSAMNRWSTIVAVSEWIKDNGVLMGVGLGNNEKVVDYVSIVQDSWGETSSISSGINSLFFSRIFEEGLPAFLGEMIFVFALIKAYFSMRKFTGHDAANRIFIVLLLAFWSLLASFAAGYRGLLYLWIFYPASITIYVTYVRSRRKRLLTKALCLN